MDFWLWRGILGIVLIILETFIGTLDALAIGIAALITALLTKIFGITAGDWKIAAGIFLAASILTVVITRFMVLPRVKGKDGPEPMSGEAIIGTTMTAQEVNGKMVVRYEGVYWNIETADTIEVGDKVVVKAMQGNHLIVKKK
jgi:membrane protein implicated in regulation of membrane protease activity